MESAAVLYEVPVLLRWICYLGGIAVYCAACYWLARAAGRQDNPFTMRQRVLMWLGRLLAAYCMVSLAVLIYSGAVAKSPMRGAPETSVLLLLLASFLLSERRRFLGRAHILRTRLPMEIFKIAAVSLICIAGFVVLAGLQRIFAIFAAQVGGPVWLPLVMTGILALVPVMILFLKARRKDMSDEIGALHLLGPVAFICLFLMLPQALQYAGNSPEIRAYFNSSPDLPKT